MNERREAVERIEKEVGIELHLQRGEPGLGEARLSGQRPMLALPSAPRPQHSLTNADQNSVNKCVQREARKKRPAQCAHTRRPTSKRRSAITVARPGRWRDPSRQLAHRDRARTSLP